MINERADWELVEIYTDEGISGLSVKRRIGFQRMIKDALDGKIDLIITKSISRMFRNTLDALKTVRQLKEKHIEIWFEKENLWSLDPQTEFILSIMASIAQEESRSISKNVYWGKQKLMAKGKGTIAYSIFLGYDKGPDGELVINPEQANTVNLIYSDFIKGLSYRGIGRHLEMLGIKSPMGKDIWRIGTIKRILSNEKYKGDALLGKTYVADFLTKKQVPNKGQSPQYYVKGCHEAIIPPEVFDRVQEEIALRAEERYQGLSIFSGKIICGECGERYGSKVHHSNDKYRKIVWRCNAKYKGTKKCRTPSLDEGKIKAAFLQVLNQILPDRNSIFEEVSMVMKAVGDTKQLEQRKAELVKEMEAIAGILNHTGDQAGYEDISDEELHLRQSQLYVAFDAVTKELRSQRVKRNNIESFVEALRSLPETVEKFDEVLWASFVEKVTVFEKDDIRFTLVTGEEIRA